MVVYLTVCACCDWSAHSQFSTLFIKYSFSFFTQNATGNHGEDVKECYYYLDSTPTHSYMKGLYKYPQREYPYVKLVTENKERTKQDREFELTDTGKTQRVFSIPRSL